VNSLRHLLLVAVLLFAQMAAGLHAVGHFADNDKGLPTHTCELCLAAHDLGSVLPSLAALPPVIAYQLAPEIRLVSDCLAFPPPQARQRGPPKA
jgi:hypothetical protein